MRVWLDGGWGVDALLGKETRAHNDLDLVIARDTAEPACEALARDGFRVLRDAEPGLPARLVLADDGDRRIDLHLVVFDAAGNGWQQLSGDAWGLYPKAGLEATGTVGGRVVPCISAELQLRHHLGYEWGADDRRDMERLAERYGLPLPPAS